MNDDLPSWLLDQIAEDERIARAGWFGFPWADGPLPSGARWVADYHKIRERTDEQRLGDTVAETRSADVSRSRHIAEWNPKRVLGECDTKRQMVAEAKYWYDKVNNLEDYPALSDRFDVAFGMLRLLALPYAHRPGYRDEWRP